MARDGARLPYDPAGPDHALRAVLQELRTGRWVAMRTLLAETTEWWRWTQRTQILAAAAAGSDVVRAWLAEEPDSTHAAVMRARVGVERALRARRERHLRAHELWIEAWDAADTATRLAPHDPVPWICLLALAQLDPGQRWAEHRADAPEPHLVPGPWGLLAEAAERDPFNREAHHRMLQFLYARGGVDDRTRADDDCDRWAHAAGYARWAAARAPLGSALHLLPLYVRVERHRRARRPDTHWATDTAVGEARSALHSWFEHAPPVRRAQPDLNHLAHALWAARQFTCAGRVFEAIGPYFSPLPWVYRVQGGGRAVDVFTRARDHCRALAEGAGPRAGTCADVCAVPRTGTHPCP
ncbi:hypothetical protein [Streptomyces sp. AM6-12]|uniref:hypothetical protein n=1 Tax=Streptomyces sp. AM6-12 TaxID=3345149 RepID=UPI0037B05943